MLLVFEINVVDFSKNIFFKIYDLTKIFFSKKSLRRGLSLVKISKVTLKATCILRKKYRFNICIQLLK